MLHGPAVGCREALEDDIVPISLSAIGRSKGFKMSLKGLLRDVRACAICEAGLPLGARPVLQLASSAKLLIISQAPGRKVHETGIPWNDASGDRLRDWLKLDRPAFYDETKSRHSTDRLLLSWCRGDGRRQAAPLRVRSALARTPPQAPTQRPVDAPGGPIRTEILPASTTEGLHDGDHQGIFGVRTAVLPFAASKLA